MTAGEHAGSTVCLFAEHSFPQQLKSPGAAVCLSSERTPIHKHVLMIVGLLFL